jgi:hypothetical protein
LATAGFVRKRTNLLDHDDRLFPLVRAISLPAEHLRNNENYDRAKKAAASQHVNERITDRCKQRRGMYEHFHFRTPSN